MLFFWRGDEDFGDKKTGPTTLEWYFVPGMHEFD